MGTVMFSGQVEYGDSVVFSQGFQLNMGTVLFLVKVSNWEKLCRFALSGVTGSLVL
jgi:hypothetical protein